MTMQASNGKYVQRAGTMTVDTGVTGVLDALNDAAVCDVRDLDDMTVVLNQLVDGGTATLTVEYTADGINWIPLTTKADTTFRAANNDAQAIPLNVTAGVPLVCMEVRVRLTAYTAGGSYSFCVTGRQTQAFR